MIRWRRPALGLVAVLVGFTGTASVPKAFAGGPAAVPAARPAVAALPPGGLVPSVANFGWTQGEFAVTDDGAATYSLPLWAPTGRGTVTPQLALSYGSRAGNGPLGVGWELTGLPSITRCPKTRAVDGFSEKLQFDAAGVLCLSGERLMPVSSNVPGQREFRTERDSFSKIVAFVTPAGVPDSFKVSTKDGQILWFGQTTDSELTARQHGDGARVTLAWAVNKVEDRNGNTAVVEYTRFDVDEPSQSDRPGQRWSSLRPEVIRYAPNRRIEFDYGARPDPVDGFAVGARTRQEYRLSRIAMFGGPEGGSSALLRQYRLGFRTSDSTGRSLLTDVSECDGAGVCKLTLPFSYSVDHIDFDRIDLPAITDVGDGTYANRQSVFPLDVDGDGRDDLLYVDAQKRWMLRRSTGSGFGPATAAGIPSFPNDAQYRQAEIRLVDVDLDGRMDVMAEVPDPVRLLPPGCDPESQQCQVNPDKRDWRLFRSTGTGFALYSTALDSGTADEDPSLDPVYFADLDGNGTPDFLTAVLGDDSDPGIDGSWRYRLNDGTEAGGRFGPEVDTRSQTGLVRGPNRPHKNAVLDVDGDGRAELVGPHVAGGIVEGYRSIGLDAAGAVERADFGMFAYDTLTNLADVNGDGLVDELWPSYDSTEVTARLNTGTGNSPRAWSAYRKPATNGLRLADITGDGRTDLVTFHATTTSDPVGMRVYNWADDRLAGRNVVESVGVPTESAGLADTQLLDVDADGALDIVHLRDGHLSVLKRKGGQPDLLRAVGSFGVAPSVELDYTTLADRDTHTPCASVYPLTCPATGGTIVAQHRSATYAAAGEPQWDTTDHRYTAARVDLHGRGWLGFASHTVTRTLTGAVATTEMDNTTHDAGLGLYPYAGLPKKTTFVVATGPGGQMARSATTFDNQIRRLPTAGTYTVEAVGTSTTEEARPPGANTWVTLRKQTTTTAYDGFGNPDLSVTATDGGRVVTEDPVFRNDTGSWQIGQPTRNSTRACTQVSGGTCVTRTSTFAYDAAGNPTVSVLEPDDAALRQETTTVYGPSGTVASITRSAAGGPARTQTFGYDADRLNPTTVTNALGHRTTYQTHSGLGVTLMVTDPNGVAATMRYDGFGRPRETNRADGSFERIGHGSFFLQVVTVTDAAGGQIETTVDQLGRTTKQKTKAFDGRLATTTTEYDPLGRVSRVSRPFLPGETAQYTTYDYDPLDRPVRQVAPDGATVRYEYVGRQFRTFDALGRLSYVDQTVDGDVAASFQDDPASTSWLQTRFEYKPFGETGKITAPDGTVQVMDYDRLGQQIRHRDPSAGTTDTTFNGYGEIATVKDATGATTAYQYDRLGRVTRTTSPDGTATTTYDTADHGVGKPATATSADDVTTTFGYDDLARPVTTTTTIPGSGSYSVDAAYDDIGRPSRLTYPAVPGISGRFAVTNVYNAHGHLARVTDAATGTAYWTVQARNADGQLTAELYGNGVKSGRTYQPTTGLLDLVTAVGAGSTKVAEISYGYDSDRNVIKRHDAVNKRWEIYGYDQLDRMNRWTSHIPAPGYVAASATFDYDEVGNLTGEKLKIQDQPEQTTVYSYDRDGPSPHRLIGRNGDRYTYDAAGRQVTGPQREVTYTTAGLPKTLDWGPGQRTTYRYDATGARVVKSDAAQTVVTIGGIFEQRTSKPGGDPRPDAIGVKNIHHVVADGRIVAEVVRTQDRAQGPMTGTSTSYHHHDGQGSTVATTSPAGTVTEKLFYDPFGVRTDARFGPLPDQRRAGTRIGYTHHEHDDEQGLINARGRIYDPEARRFLTPDPLVADPLNGQHHNRYSYVANNPATRTDPTGLLLTESPWDTRGFGSRGSFGAGYSALGYTSGGPTGWTGPLGAPLVAHAPTMAAPTQRVGMSFPHVDGQTIQARLGEVVREWHEMKAKAEAAANPKLGDVYVPDDGIQGHTQVGQHMFWREGEKYMIWYPGDGEPVQVSRATWEEAKALAAGPDEGFSFARAWDVTTGVAGTLSEVLSDVGLDRTPIGKAITYLDSFADFWGVGVSAYGLGTAPNALETGVAALQLTTLVVERGSSVVASAASLPAPGVKVHPGYKVPYAGTARTAGILARVAARASAVIFVTWEAFKLGTALREWYDTAEGQIARGRELDYYHSLPPGVQ